MCSQEIRDIIFSYWSPTKAIDELKKDNLVYRIFMLQLKSIERQAEMVVNDEQWGLLYELLNIMHHEKIRKQKKYLMLQELIAKLHLS